jgi:HAD superfamily hydrolase (TIGR01450 family)
VSEHATSWVLDLDGVVWLAGEPLPGAVDAVNALLAAGEDVAFVTNNSNPTVREHHANLAAIGIDATGLVVSSAMAASRLINTGERVLLCAGPGAREAVEGAGAVPLEDTDDAVDAVLVGLTRDFDYDVLRRAATAVRRGARFLATNDDATYPTRDGPIPGAGSILAAVERASGQRATVAGKPYAAMVDLLRERLGPNGTVVGDRPDTDGRLARAMGYRFALVLTGVTSSADFAAGVEPAPDEVAADLAELVARHLQG